MVGPMNIIGIYKIENLTNGKKYIGQSCDIMKRWADHRWALENDRHTNGHLQNAWNKAQGHFDFSVIETCEAEELDAREEYWIAYYRANDPALGYNLTSGGDGIRGLVRTAEHCRHISESLIGRVGVMKGRRFTHEHRQKIAKALRGNRNMHSGKDNTASKAVRCIETGEVFETMTAAGLHYGSKSVTPGVNIRKCCLGERPTALGHTWEFVTDVGGGGVK